MAVQTGPQQGWSWRTIVTGAAGLSTGHTLLHALDADKLKQEQTEVAKSSLCGRVTRAVLVGCATFVQKTALMRLVRSVAATVAEAPSGSPLWAPFLSLLSGARRALESPPVQRAVNTLVEGERIVLGHTERALMERVPLQLKTLWLVEVGFLVPVVEELFFRGVQGGVGAVQNRVKAWLPEQARRWKGVEWLTSPSARIVFVQTLFALCHFVALREQGSPTQRTALTVAILCTPAFPILGERSLGEAMVAHATVNAWVFATRS